MTGHGAGYLFHGDEAGPPPRTRADIDRAIMLGLARRTLYALTAALVAAAMIIASDLRNVDVPTRVHLEISGEAPPQPEPTK